MTTGEVRRIRTTDGSAGEGFKNTGLFIRDQRQMSQRHLRKTSMFRLYVFWESGEWLGRLRRLIHKNTHKMRPVLENSSNERFGGMDIRRRGSRIEVRQVHAREKIPQISDIQDSATGCLPPTTPAKSSRHSRPSCDFHRHRPNLEYRPSSPAPLSSLLPRLHRCSPASRPHIWDLGHWRILQRRKAIR